MLWSWLFRMLLELIIWEKWRTDPHTDKIASSRAPVVAKNIISVQQTCAGSFMFDVFITNIDTSADIHQIITITRLTLPVDMVKPWYTHKWLIHAHQIQWSELRTWETSLTLRVIWGYVNQINSQLYSEWAVCYVVGWWPMWL